MLNTSFFHDAVPARPMGRYAHIILLRQTDSYALFQTDGELNTARVQAGITQSKLITRITLFKRKQTTPERLVGRELLRRYGLVSTLTSGGKKNEHEVAVDEQGLPICDYNVDFCKQCPDCISYGFAIGDAGSEKSKVLSDTAYSLSPFEISHETFTLNAPYESGSMAREGQTSSRINQQDHVRPLVLFPSIITLRDATPALFEYVLSNLLRTRRYGAQTTRTGTVQNHVLGIALADGEICSNLYFTQRLYDQLASQETFNPDELTTTEQALGAATEVLPKLLDGGSVSFSQKLLGEDVATYLSDFRDRMSNDEAMQQMLKAANGDSARYHQAFIKKSKGKK